VAHCAIDNSTDWGRNPSAIRGTKLDGVIVGWSGANEFLLWFNAVIDAVAIGQIGDTYIDSFDIDVRSSNINSASLCCNGLYY
jgi:hypothetical protein